MVELSLILKKAFWSLAAGGLVYVSIILLLTLPDVQRLYVACRIIYALLLFVIDGLWLMIDKTWGNSALYAHKLNPAYWENINDVEYFGFISVLTILNTSSLGSVANQQKRNSGSTI